MKASLKKILALALVLTLLPAWTLAADTGTTQVGGIQIQINNEILEIKSGVEAFFDTETNRNFVPLRDIFEALGAEVSYDEATRLITATRGDTLVEFYQGSNDIKVTRGGKTETINADVTPITVDGRIMVPVRFVAQALGASVGWDSANKTVVIFDAPLLLEAYGDEYTLLNGLLAFGRPPEGKSTKMTAKMDMSLEIADAGTGEPAGIAASVTYDMLASDMAATGTMEMVFDIADMLALSGEDAIPGLEGSMTVTVDLIMDMEQMVFYIHSDFLSQMMGIAGENAWLKLDLAGMLSMTGMGGLDLAAVTSVEDILAAAISGVTLHEVTDIEYILEELALINSFISDDGFTLRKNPPSNNDVYSRAYELPEQMGAIDIAIAVNADGDVTGYEVTADIDYEGVAIKVDISYTGSKAVIQMVMSDPTMSISINMDADYSFTDEKPNTQLPAGAEVIDLF